MRRNRKVIIAVLVAVAILVVVAFFMLSGRPGRMNPNWTINETSMDEVSGIFDAGSSEEISAYCQGNPVACAYYCRNNPENELCGSLDIRPRRY